MIQQTLYSAKEMDRIFHFDSLKQFDKLYTFHPIREYLWQSCSDSKCGNCPPDLVDFQCQQIHQLNIYPFGDLLIDQYCQSASAGVDSDIAGLGVSILS